MQNKLYVGNLNYAATQQDMSDFFTHSGTVLETILITDRSTGNSRGFGFVTMETEEDALRAIKQLNGKELLGRPVKIKIAFDRREEDSRGGRSSGSHRTRHWEKRGRRGGGGHGHGRGKGHGHGHSRGRGGHRSSRRYRS